MANLLLESYNQSRSLFINGGTRVTGIPHLGRNRKDDEPI